MDYVYSAKAYEKDAALARLYGNIYPPIELSQWRSWCCWSAAIKRGLIIC